jgi:uncharacterized protein YjbJ (UPF0337 family)
VCRSADPFRFRTLARTPLLEPGTCQQSPHPFLVDLSSYSTGISVFPLSQFGRPPRGLHDLNALCTTPKGGLAGKKRVDAGTQPFPQWHHYCNGNDQQQVRNKTPSPTNFKIMNRLRFCGTWAIVKGKLKQGWARMTGNDPRYLGGRELEFTGRMQRCVGRVRDGAQTRIVRTIRRRTNASRPSNRALIRPLRILPPSGRSTSFRVHGQ